MVGLTKLRPSAVFIKQKQMENSFFNNPNDSIRILQDYQKQN